MDFQKIKYQGIKITASSNNRTSYGGNVQRTNNTDRINHNDSAHPSNRVNTDRSMTDNGFLSTSFNNNSQQLPSTVNNYSQQSTISQQLQSTIAVNNYRQQSTVTVKYYSQQLQSTITVNNNRQLQ